MDKVVSIGVPGLNMDFMQYVYRHFHYYHPKAEYNYLVLIPVIISPCVKLL